MRRPRRVAGALSGGPVVCRSCELDLPAAAYREAIDRWKDEVCEAAPERGEDDARREGASGEEP